MLYKLIVALHILGACIWVGGHLVLMAVVLPRAFARREPGRIIEFEQGYGRLGLAALLVQLSSGLWLALRWTGGVRELVIEPSPLARLILLKLALLGLTLFVGGAAYHSVLPRVARGEMRPFAAFAGLTTLLAIILLVLGVVIRTGGLP